MIRIPFIGNKYNYCKRVIEIVKECGYKKVFEPFGGSGVLSVNLYHEGLVEEAVLNDYDKLFDTYEEFLDLKDWVVSECLRQGVRRRYENKDGIYYIEDGERVYVEKRSLPPDERKILQDCMRQIDPKWYRLFAYGTNFCNSIVTTHEKVRVTDFALFQRHLETDQQRYYLDVVRQIERVSMDWRLFFEEIKSRITPDTLLIVDPPYFLQNANAYKGSFTEEETLELLDAMLDLGTDFIYFNQAKGQTDRWLKDNGIKGYEYIFKNYEANIFFNHSRIDFMLHVRLGEQNGFKNS